jgi:adenylate cyclase
VSHLIPANESRRLVALRRYEILDTAPEIAYDEIAELAAQICRCFVAFISFIDDDRRWLKAKYGLPPEITEAPNRPARVPAGVGHALTSRRDFAGAARPSSGSTPW